MPVRSNIAEFRAEATAISAAVRDEIRDRWQELGVRAYAELIEATENVDAVDTGAYRAEHVIEQDGAFVFEHPQRPGTEGIATATTGDSPSTSGSDAFRAVDGLAQSRTNFGLTPLDGEVLAIGPQSQSSRKKFGLPPLIGPPDLEAVAAALASARVGKLTFANRIFYAHWLEDGTKRMEPRRIYARAAQATEAFAEQLAQEPPRNPVLVRASAA